MNVYDSKLWISDLDETLTYLPELSELEGKSVLITGCYGLICSAVTDLLIRWNECHTGKVMIYAAGRSRERTENRFRPYIGKDWFIYVPYDAASSDNLLDFHCDYIIHGASNASPNKIVKEPVETMLGNFEGMKNLLDYAVKEETKRVLLVSSSEVYGKIESNEPLKDDYYGHINILDPRSSYSIAKCASETLCTSYAAEYGTEVVITRPGHIYGPTASISDIRVSSAWAYAAARGENIVMKSEGTQIRSYCYCLDCASAIFKVLLRGENVHAYNISNPDSIINIRGMAELLAKHAGVELIMELPTETERKRFNPMNNSSLDSTSLMNLGWKGLFSADRGFSHTVEIIKEMI